jgi:hypothetical protein
VRYFLNLARFTVVAAAIAFAFAFNLAAMYAQVVYVFLPGTRVTGAPAMNWASAGSDVTNGVRHATDFDQLLVLGIVGVIALAFILRIPRKDAVR